MQKQMARRRWKKLLGITLIVIIALVGLGITLTESSVGAILTSDTSDDGLH